MAFRRVRRPAVAIREVVGTVAFRVEEQSRWIVRLPIFARDWFESEASLPPPKERSCKEQNNKRPAAVRATDLIKKDSSISDEN